MDGRFNHSKWTMRHSLFYFLFYARRQWNILDNNRIITEQSSRLSNIKSSQNQRYTYFIRHLINSFPDSLLDSTTMLMFKFEIYFLTILFGKLLTIDGLLFEKIHCRAAVCHEFKIVSLHKSHVDIYRWSKYLFS